MPIFSPETQQRLNQINNEILYKKELLKNYLAQQKELLAKKESINKRLNSLKQFEDSTLYKMNLSLQKKNELEAKYNEVLAEEKMAQSNFDAANMEIIERLAQVENLQSRLEKIKQDISLYNYISNMPDPQPIYRIENERCINGIYHCKNHPPFQTLLNGEEINSKRQAKRNAQATIQSLSDEFNNVSTKIKKNEASIAEARSKIFFLESTLSQKTAACNYANSLYQASLREYNALKSLYPQLENQVKQWNQAQIESKLLVTEGDQLEQQIAYVMQEISNLEFSIQQLDSEFNQIRSANITQNDLENIALRELDKEKKADSIGSSSDISMPQDNNLLSQLEQLAMEEIKNETATLQNFSHSVHSAASRAKTLANDVVTTISSIYPSAANLATSALFYRINEELDIGNPEHTGNLLLDNAFKKKAN